MDMTNKIDNIEVNDLRGMVDKIYPGLIDELIVYFNKTKEYWDLIKPCVKQCYIDAGMPYGDNDEGMWKWVGESNYKANWKEQIRRHLCNYIDKCVEVEKAIVDVYNELSEYLEDEFFVDWNNVDDACDVWVVTVNDFESIIILEEVSEKVETGMSIEDAVKSLLMESFTV